MAQDSFDYGSSTHHTNLDTYERIYEEDVREGAVEIASAVYALAMADQMVPRFEGEKMPKPVPEPGPGSQAAPVRHVPTNQSRTFINKCSEGQSSAPLTLRHAGFIGTRWVSGTIFL